MRRETQKDGSIHIHQKDDVKDGTPFKDVPDNWVIEFGDGEKGIKTGMRNFYSYQSQRYALVDDVTLKVKQIKKVCSPGRMYGNR